jgi:Bacteriophage baseplate protein W
MSDEPRNLLIPFRRDKKRDFASGSGPDLLRSKVLQALMTAGATPRSSGELPWRTAFGAGLELLRHQRSDAALGELARVQIRDALRRWVPEAELVSVKVERSEATLELRVRVRESGRAAGGRDTEELVLAVSA